MKGYITVRRLTHSMLYKKHTLGLIVIAISCLVIQSSIIESSTIEEIQPRISDSCTIFTATIGDKVFFGNNEDYKYTNHYRWYIPAQNVSTTYFGQKTIYGAVFFGFDNNDDSNVDGWEQGGMNEHGLSFDANGLPDINMNVDPSASYPYTPHALAQSLWDCRNVEEVINWYKNIKWDGVLGGQIHYADSTGDAVVVGLNSTGQWVFTRIAGSYLVSTNFSLNDTSCGYYPCWRYETANQMLSEISSEEELNVSICADILYAVHQEGTYATKYSNICDPVTKEFYFNYGEGYSIQEKFNLTAELADIDSFESRNSFMGVYGVDGGVLVKVDQIDPMFTPSTTDETSFGNTLTLLAIILPTVSLTYVFVKKRNL